MALSAAIKSARLRLVLACLEALFLMLTDDPDLCDRGAKPQNLTACLGD